MPRRLLVIGWVCCVLGALTLIDFVVGIVRDNAFAPGVNLLLLPVGIGLLTARRSARALATFVAGVNAATLIATTAGFFLGEMGEATLSVGGLELAGATAQVLVPALSIVVTALCVLVIWMLYTPPVSDEFRGPGKRIRHSEAETPLTGL